MIRRSLLVDGEWNLKRNFNSRLDCISSTGEHCGGVYGFLDTLASAISKILPDRVIVVWDGDMSGKYRNDIYPLYKLDHKSWEEEAYYKTDYQIDAEERKKISCLNQKIKTKNLIDGLFIRQIEVKYIEGDDLIAGYILGKPEEEHVYIFSRDQDYYQLIDETVSIIRPDKIILTAENFRRLIGFTHKNALLLKCFEGDDSDNISGIPLVKRKTLIKYFPLFTDEEYSIDRVISEAVVHYNKIKTKKKPVTLENIIGSRQVVERNRELMDLKNPFLNDEAKNEIETIRNCVMVKEDGYADRSISDVMKETLKEGYSRYMYKNDVSLFFTPYFRIASKEKEYAKRVFQDYNSK